jgi:hypothetical protein
MFHAEHPVAEYGGEFSICQGDPVASLFFVMNAQPFFGCLEALLSGLFVSSIRALENFHLSEMMYVLVDKKWW